MKLEKIKYYKLRLRMKLKINKTSTKESRTKIKNQKKNILKLKYQQQCEPNYTFQGRKEETKASS